MVRNGQFSSKLLSEKPPRLHQIAVSLHYLRELRDAGRPRGEDDDADHPPRQPGRRHRHQHMQPEPQRDEDLLVHVVQQEEADKLVAELVAATTHDRHGTWNMKKGRKTEGRIFFINIFLVLGTMAIVAFLYHLGFAQGSLRIELALRS